MSVFIDTCTLILLLVVVVQDMFYRAISWFLIPLLFLTFAFKGLLLIQPSQLVINSLINFGFILFQLLILSLYMSIKNKKVIFIVNSYLGLGDILFFVVICLAFSPANFIVFYLSSLIFTLIAFIAYTLIVKNANKHIPLAGIMAALMTILILLNWMFPEINLYKDFILTLI